VNFLKVFSNIYAIVMEKDNILKHIMIVEVLISLRDKNIKVVIEHRIFFKKGLYEILFIKRRLF
jgi:hypothetical protein